MPKFDPRVSQIYDDVIAALVRHRASQLDAVAVTLGIAITTMKNEGLGKEAGMARIGEVWDTVDRTMATHPRDLRPKH